MLPRVNTVFRRITLPSLALFLLLMPALAKASAFECSGDLDSGLKANLLNLAEKKYREISGLRAQFIQQSLFAGWDKKDFSKGTVVFKRPGMMDWSYEQPEAQRFVSDGHVVWFYQPSFNQVAITDFENSFSSDVPYTFLLGIGSLVKSFSLQSACKTGEGIMVQLQPKEADKNLSQFYLLLRASDYAPIGAKIRDVGGTETTFMFINEIFNPNLQSEQFVFEIPKGVDVLDSRKEFTHSKVSESDLVGSASEEKGLAKRFEERAKKK